MDAESLEKEFSIQAPRVHAPDSVHTGLAFENEHFGVFISIGDNFAPACSDTVALNTATQRVRLTEHVSTKPNRSHLVHGTKSLILLTRSRTDSDDNHPKVR